MRKFNKEVRKKIFFLLIVLTAFSLFYSFYPSISNFISSYFSAFSAFNFMRFIFLNTFIFYLIILFIAQKPNIYLKIVLISLIVLNSLRCMDFYYNTFGRFLDKNKSLLENQFYKKIMFNKNFIYKNRNEHSSYDLIDNSKLTVFIDRTLVYQSLSSWNINFALSARSKYINNPNFIFGWPDIKKN